MALEKLDQETVNKVMERLPPQARIALDTLSKMQNRSPEDVLRDEIKNYIQGRLPAIDLDRAMSAIKVGAHQAGYLFGRLRRFAQNLNRED